jgi:hypothetical protein
MFILQDTTIEVLTTTQSMRGTALKHHKSFQCFQSEHTCTQLKVYEVDSWIRQIYGTMSVWQGVAIKFHPGLAGGLPLKRSYGRFWVSLPSGRATCGQLLPL